jgi:hypothetical protein
MNRRKFLGFLAAGGAIAAAPALLLPERTIFLPPIGGWPHGRIEALMQMIIPKSDIDFWADEIAEGQFSYDPVTEVLRLLKPSAVPTVSATWDTPTPGALLPSSEPIHIFAKNGITPFVYVGRAQADDARELQIMETRRQELRQRRLPCGDES